MDDNVCFQCGRPLNTNRIFCSGQCRSDATKYAWKYRLDRKESERLSWIDRAKHAKFVKEHEDREVV